MTGKQKCRILKEIRRQIAEQNDIRYVIEECTHKGNCRGTCPKCEWEVQMLERELEKRRAAGKKVVLAGISAGFLMTSCSPLDAVKELFSPGSQQLDGDMMADTTVSETLEGKLLPEALEGEPAVVEPEDETADRENEIDSNGSESEDFFEIAGGLLAPTDETEEEFVLEGDIICPTEEEDLP